MDFSDRTFAEFFQTELGVNIDDPKWSKQGGSKGKRLRYYLLHVNDNAARKALEALWEYREAYLLSERIKDPVQESRSRYEALISRLGGRKSPGKPPEKASTWDIGIAATLGDELLKMSSYPAQDRGYRFEKFLTKTFNLFGLEAKEPFRNRGEQIDGSFQLGNETYLIEAKWQSDRVGNLELHAFHGKIEQKAAWARGLFVSYSGFTEEGLDAFGRGKRVVCMDGLDLSETFARNLSLADVLERKVRKAAETGAAFSRVRDLF